MLSTSPTSITSPNTTTEDDFEDNDSVLAEDEENKQTVGEGVARVGAVGETNVSFTQNPLSDTFYYYDTPDNGNNLKQEHAPMSFVDGISSWFQKLREKDLIIPSLTTITLILIMASLIVIVIAVTAPYKDITTVNVVDIMSYRSSLLSFHTSMKGNVDLHLTNQFQGDYLPIYSYFWYYFMRSVMEGSLQNITSLLPPDFKHEYLDNTNNYTKAFQTPIVKLWDNVLMGPTMYPFSYKVGNETINWYMVDNQKMALAQKTYSYANYTTMLNSYENSFFGFVGNITQYCENISTSAKNYYIVTISIVGFCLFIVIPTMMLALFFIMKKDRNNAIQLNQTSETLLKDTMSDMALRQAFKSFCNERGFGVHINAIEKIMSFKEHCEHSQEMQMKLIEITSDYVHKVNAMQNQNQFHHTGEKVDFKIDDKKTRAVFTISCEAEKKIKHKEYLKSSLIFDLLEETQEVASSKVITELVYAYDCYNNREKIFEDIDILPQMMLDKLEHELSDLLMNTHLDFKVSLKNNTILSQTTTEPQQTDIEREEFELQLVNV